MGGLRKKIPWTYWTMLIATLAIAGVPGFAGFFSKDEILSRRVHESVRKQIIVGRGNFHRAAHLILYVPADLPHIFRQAANMTSMKVHVHESPSKSC